MTAVSEATRAIAAARTEAECNMPNGIGVVKLMGRSAGFLAAYATLASQDVDLCLVPEVPIVMEGPQGVLPHLERVIDHKGHAVVVVAEGAGEELLGASAEVDAGGNKKLPAIGEWLVAEIKKHFKASGKEATLKYIDPSYMVRSVAADAGDSYLCMLLAHAAAHGSMAGSRAPKESEIPNVKGSDLGRFPLVSADFWTNDHLSERSRSVDAFSGTRARGTLMLKRT